MTRKRRRSPVESSSGDLKRRSAPAVQANARESAKARYATTMLRAFKRLQLKPGDIYESCSFHPCLCLGVDYKQDEVWGISLIDGSYPQACSLVHCGVRKLSLKGARDIKFRGPDSAEDRERISPSRRWWVEGADPSPLRIRFAGPRGRIASEVRETAAAMHRTGTMDKKTFREIDVLTRPKVAARRRK